MKDFKVYALAIIWTALAAAASFFIVYLVPAVDKLIGG